jgi:hypothetical protein
MSLSKSRCINLIITGIFSFIFYGCFTVASLQSPKVLERDKVEFVMAPTIIYSNDSIKLYEVLFGMREGIGSNTDYGLRFYSKPPVGYRKSPCPNGCWVGVYGDVKHQFTNESPLISSSLGLSYTTPFILTLYPSLIIGSERAFVTGKLITVGGLIPYYFGLYPDLSIGFSIGNKLRIYPEMGILGEIDLIEGISDTHHNNQFLPNLTTFYISIGLSYRP